MKCFLLLLLLSEPNPLCFSAQSGVLTPDLGGWASQVIESSWIPFINISITVIYFTLGILVLLPVLLLRLE